MEISLLLQMELEIMDKSGVDLIHSAKKEQASEENKPVVEKLDKLDKLEE